MEIRPVRPEEYEEAGEVTALAYREHSRPGDDWEEYFTRLRDVASREETAIVLIAVEDDGRILGTVTLELDERIDGGHEREPLAPGEAHIRMLGVRPDARRRGAAKALMERCIEESRAAGKTFMTLNTTERMKAAQQMYESMGFERGEDRVFDDGFCLLSYSLEL